MARWGKPPHRVAPRRGGPGGGRGSDVRRVDTTINWTGADGRTPGQLGEPPAWLDDRRLPIIEPGDSLFFHCHTLKRGPLSFNFTAKGRFNAPGGEYGTAYLSTSVEGAFVETLLQDVPRNDRGTPTVTRSRLKARCLCAIPYETGKATRPLRLVDLSADGALAIGATGELCALADIGRLALVQRWALQLYEHRDAPDGIYYRARHDPSRLSIALFDRARGVLIPDCSTNLLTDPAKLGRLLNHYLVALIEDTS